MIDDSFRAWPMGKGPAPFALCPRDREPLVATIEQAGAEFVCVVCHTYYGFLAPVAGEPTEQLAARLAELEAIFDAERAARTTDGPSNVSVKS